MSLIGHYLVQKVLIVDFRAIRVDFLLVGGVLFEHFLALFDISYDLLGHENRDRPLVDIELKAGPCDSHR